MGTPLSVVAGRAELIASGQLSEPDTRSSATVINQEADRIARTIRRLLEFARCNTPQRAPTYLRDVVRETVVLRQTLADKNDVELTVTLPDQPVVAEVDAGQIQQVVTNLVLNAIQATRAKEDSRRVDVTVQSGQQWHRVVVADSGTGIASEDQEHLFEPFFTTKDVGEGTGLGLSISHGIISEHDGWIDVQSEFGAGSRFSVFLPVQTNAPSSPALDS